MEDRPITRRPISVWSTFSSGIAITRYRGLREPGDDSGGDPARAGLVHRPGALQPSELLDRFPGLVVAAEGADLVAPVVVLGEVQEEPFGGFVAAVGDAGVDDVLDVGGFAGGGAAVEDGGCGFAPEFLAFGFGLEGGGLGDGGVGPSLAVLRLAVRGGFRADVPLVVVLGAAGPLRQPRLLILDEAFGVDE